MSTLYRVFNSAAVWACGRGLFPHITSLIEKYMAAYYFEIIKFNIELLY